jgi:hypothetical protein
VNELLKIAAMQIINCPMCHRTETRIEFNDGTSVMYTIEAVRMLAVGDTVEMHLDGWLEYKGRDD